MSDLEALSPMQRADYEACVLGGVRVTDRARERGVAVGTVSKHLHRARKKLGESP